MSASKQKLAEMVLKKMKQKKQAQQLARPHHQVLQQQITFSLQHNQCLSSNISALCTQVAHYSANLLQLKNHLCQLQNTGKQSYPMIIIKPEFIASENVNSQMKEFYRKASNTFCRNDIVKQQKYHQYMQRQQQIKAVGELVIQAEIQAEDRLVRDGRIRNGKRLAILKADLNRRKNIQSYQQTCDKIMQSKALNTNLLLQYQLKKQNLNQRTNFLTNLTKSIEQIKQQITTKYNPTSYRQYLKKIFDIRIKNQYMESNLIKAIENLNSTKNKLLQHRNRLQEKCKLTFFGITHDSPSKQKGKLQKTLSHLKQIHKSTNPKSISDLLSSPNPQLKKPSIRRQQNVSQTQNMSQSPRLRRSLRKSSNDRNYSSLKTLKSTLRTEATNNHSGTKRYQSIY